MIIDRLTKYFYIILFREKYILLLLRTIIFKKLIPYYKVLKEIISNGNKFFTSNYWKMLILLLGLRLKVFTIYYSKTYR